MEEDGARVQELRNCLIYLMDSETQKIRIMHAMTFAEKNLRQAWNAIQTGDLEELHANLAKTTENCLNGQGLALEQILFNRAPDQEMADSTKLHDVEGEV